MARARVVLIVCVVLASAGCAIDRGGGGERDARAPDGGARDGGDFDARADDASPPDARPFDAPTPDDAGSDSGTVDLGPFRAPELVRELSSPATAEDDPTLTRDQLLIVFNSSRTGNGDIYFATRASISTPFDTPMPLAEANSSEYDSTPQISPDGLTLWFSSERGGRALDLYVMQRTSLVAPWSPPTPVSELNTGSIDASPWISPDGLSLAIDSNRSGNLEVWETTRPAVDGRWAEPTVLPGLSAPGRDANPALSPDFQQVWYTSDRPGSRADDIWWSVRPARDQPFAAPSLVAELASPGSDEDAWLSEDLRTVYFASDRSGNYEIYRATR